MAEWPEPEADPEEKRRWWGRLAIAGALGAGVILTANGGELRLPEFELPEFELPEVAVPDLRGREVSDTAPDVSYDDPMIAMLGEPLADGAPFSQPAPFEQCVETIEGASEAFGPPAVIEDTPTRRMVTFKLPDGFMTMTCADGAMTIEPRR